MAQTSQVIELLTDTNGSFIHNERLAATAGFKPGVLVEEVPAGVQPNSSAGTNAQKLFALTNTARGGTIDDDYVVGETARYGAAHSGQEVYAWVAAAATAIPFGSALESAGDGTLRIQTAAAATANTARDSVVAYAAETVDNSLGGTAVRIKARVA